MQARPTGTRPTGRPSVSSTLSHEFFDVQEFDDGNQVSISFYAFLLCQYFCAKKIHSQNITREKLREALWYKKFLGKMFMMFSPGVNFTNILRAAFTLVDPKSVKNTVKSSVSFYAFRICVRKTCT